MPIKVIAAMRYASRRGQVKVNSPQALQIALPSPSLRQSGVLDVPQFAHTCTDGEGCLFGVVGGGVLWSCGSCDGRWWWKMFSLRNWWDGEGGWGPKACSGACCCCCVGGGLLCICGLFVNWEWIEGDSRTTEDIVCYATLTRVEDGVVSWCLQVARR